MKPPQGFMRIPSSALLFICCTLDFGAVLLAVKRIKINTA
jgi:hypothetical protein